MLIAKALSLAVIAYSPCPAMDVPACTEPPNVVYVGDGVERGVLNHELGHVIDFNLLTDADRGRFRVYALRQRAWYFSGQPFPTLWWGEPNPFGEEFAEAVRMCARSVRFPDRGLYNWMPTVDTHRRVCRWLVRRFG